MEEKKHTPIVLPQTYPSGLGFPMAVEMVIGGKKISRASWENKGIYLALHEGWLSLFQPGRPPAKVLLSQADLEGADWIIADDLS